MDMLDRLKLRLTENGVVPDEAILTDIMESAKSAILSRRYPYGDWPTNEDGETYVESRYQDLQFRICIATYEKLGAEYQTSHGENGIQRQWGSEGIPQELLAEIVPYAGIVS